MTKMATKKMALKMAKGEVSISGVLVYKSALIRICNTSHGCYVWFCLSKNIHMHTQYTWKIKKSETFYKLFLEIKG